MGRLNHRNLHLSGLEWCFLLWVVRNHYCFGKGVSGVLEGYSSGDFGIFRIFHIFHILQVFHIFHI